MGNVSNMGKADNVCKLPSQSTDWLLMIYASACNDLQSEFQSFLNCISGKRLNPNCAVLLQITLPQREKDIEAASPLPSPLAPVMPKAPNVPLLPLAPLAHLTHLAPSKPLVPLAPSELSAQSAQTYRYASTPDTLELSLVPNWSSLPRPAHNPRHLYDFIKWGLSLAEYRNARPILILSGHSAGMLGVLEDRSGGYPMLMTIPAMVHAIRAAQAATQRRFGLLILDMCFMNSVEILYELAGPEMPVADYVILPYDDAPLAGMPLEKLIAALPSLSKPAAASRAGITSRAKTVSSGETEQAVQAIVNCVNHHWSNNYAFCYGIGMESSRMEAMAESLNAIAAKCIGQSLLQANSQLPYLEITQCVRDNLAPYLIVTAGQPSPAPSLRINLAEDLRRRRIPGEVYGALRFSRLSDWKRLITNTSFRSYSTKLFPKMIVVPREIIIEDLLERFPAWNRSQAERKLKELGWIKSPDTEYSLESKLSALPAKIFH